MNLMMYHCMLIVTDGDIHDMTQTTDLIIELSKYPVSIIIIGVGEDSFDKMKQLDSDDRVLRGSKGQSALRDIVQFVKFADFTAKGMSALAEEVLKELPDQIVGYMLANGIKPAKVDFHSAEALMMQANIGAHLVSRL